MEIKAQRFRSHLTRSHGEVAPPASPWGGHGDEPQNRKGVKVGAPLAPLLPSATTNHPNRFQKGLCVAQHPKKIPVSSLKHPLEEQGGQTGPPKSHEKGPHGMWYPAPIACGASSRKKNGVTVRVPRSRMGNPQQRLLPPPHAGSKLSRAERSSCPSRHGARSSANKPAHCRAQPPLVCHDHWHRGKQRCRFSSSISSPTPLPFVGRAARGMLPLRHWLSALRHASGATRCQRHPQKPPSLRRTSLPAIAC